MVDHPKVKVGSLAVFTNDSIGVVKEFSSAYHIHDYEIHVVKILMQSKGLETCVYNVTLDSDGKTVGEHALLFGEASGRLVRFE